MNLLFGFLAILFVCNPFGEKRKKSSYSEVMNVIRQYSDSIKKDQGAELKMYGLSYAGKDKVYDGKVHFVNLTYGIDKRIKYKEGRELFYSIVNGLIQKINQDESLKDYFYHYPVGYEDLSFDIAFDYHQEGKLKKDDLYMISIDENEIMYFFVQKDGEGPERQFGKIVEGMCQVETDWKLRSVVRKLPEDAEVALLDK